MKKYFIPATGFIFLLLAVQVPAVTIFECVDDAGLQKLLASFDPRPAVRMSGA